MYAIFNSNSKWQKLLFASFNIWYQKIQMTTIVLIVSNKIIDRDWFFAPLFVAQSAHDHVGVLQQVSIENFLLLDTHMIPTSITRAMMAFFVIFPLVLIGATHFSLKRSSRKTFCNFEILLLVRLISNWTSCSLIQGVIMFEISITRPVTLCSVLHSVQLLLWIPPRPLVLIGK